MIVLIVTVVLCAPVFEHYDRWDGFPSSGNDIVLTLVAALICFAAGLVVVRIVRTTNSETTASINVARIALLTETGHIGLFVGTSSPPLSLRI